jgi:transglutaminase-like putative cysteine protease
MRDRLFPFLVVLTLLDLAFVQATDVVSGLGLLPMWLLAATAPWLRRMQRHRGYRVTWNAAVIVTFAVLVRHATTTGLLYMLEDGLLLAVLCQVHLLNNVGERQRPDLVFFNSLLVAFVTSFFAPDLMWSLLFIAHAFALVPALQVNLMVRRGVDVDRSLMLSALRDGARRTFAICVATAFAFALLPRDFGRQGWLGDVIMPERQSGISEQIRLDDEYPTRLSGQVVMRIEPASGLHDDVPTHWRAIAFSVFDGGAWLPMDSTTGGPSMVTDVPWVQEPDGTWRRDVGRESIRLRIRLHDLASHRLPSPLNAQSMVIQRGDRMLVDAKSYGVLSVHFAEDMSETSIDYEVGLARGGGTVRATARLRDHLSMPPDAETPAILRDLATQLEKRLSWAQDEETLAQAHCDWLMENRRYQVPGEPGFARNLSEFLIGTGAGHCEYFATTLALLLRMQGIPCRLVGGYLAYEWDPSTKSVLVRAMHAHAWVEVLRRDGSWLTLDPTPPSDLRAHTEEQTSWLHGMWQHLEKLWDEVVGFDRERRETWLKTMAELPAEAFRKLGDPRWATVALVPLVLLFWHLRRRQQNEPSIVEFERALRAAGLSLRAG